MDNLENKLHYSSQGRWTNRTIERIRFTIYVQGCCPIEFRFRAYLHTEKCQRFVYLCRDLYDTRALS